MKTLPKLVLMTLLVLGALLMTTVSADAHGRFRGGFMIGPAIRPWGWYSPFYGPYGFYGYGPYGYPYAYSDAGEVKLSTNVKDAQVFINGSYAGTAKKLKSMWLRPDAYNLEIRAPGWTQYAERIYVVAGKTLHIHADLRPQARP
jgi:PEGA domain-containing protein